jgi:hypothetical protein
MTSINSQNGPESEDRFANKQGTDKYPTEGYMEDEYKKLMIGSFGNKKSLYDKAKELDIKAEYDLEYLEPKEQLERIESLISISVKITSLEAFKFGKYFIIARRACRLCKIRFPEWLDESFKISHKTAVNYMNVYRNCLSMMSIAVKIPISILVKISAPSFSEELREYLFEHGDLEKMSNKALKHLIELHKDGKFEEIKNCVETWNSHIYICRQTEYVLDRYRAIYTDLRSMKTKIEKKYGIRVAGMEEWDKLLPDAKNAIIILLSAINEAISILEKPLIVVEDIIFKLNCDTLDKSIM